MRQNNFQQKKADQYLSQRPQGDDGEDLETFMNETESTNNKVNNSEKIAQKQEASKNSSKAQEA